MLNPTSNPVSGNSNSQNASVQRTDGRPQKDANKRKDFRKVLDGEAEEQEIAAAEEKLSLRKARERSIFDLPKKESPKKEVATTAPAIAVPMQPLTEAQTDLSTLIASKQSLKRQSEHEDSGDYAQLQGDLSYVNPQLASGQAVTSIPKFDIEANTAGEAPGKTATVQQIVDQIVDKIYTLKANGQTETVMTLKNPPALAEAQLVLTGFDHARGEFNIAIHNLTQAAQSFLEQNNLRLGLKQALEEKGYTVHMVVATTEPYQKTIAVENTETSGKQRREEREESSQDNPNRQRQGRG